MYKLQFQIDENEKTYVENLVITDWKSARIIHIKGTNGPITPEERDHIVNTFHQKAVQENLTPPIVVFGESLDVSVYVLEETPQLVRDPYQLALELDSDS